MAKTSPEVVADRRALDARGLARERVGVLVLVDVDQRVGAEVDRVGAGGEGAVVHVRVEHLRRQCLPAPRRAAVGEARPAGADAAEALLDLRDQLLVDGIAIGTQVRRVHRVAVVVVRIGVLDLDHEEAREVRGDPLLVERIRLLLLDPVVAGEVEALGVVGLEVRIRRGGAELRRCPPGSGRGTPSADSAPRDACRSPSAAARARPGRRRAPRTSTAARS